MSLYSFYRISKPSKDKVPPDRVDAEFRRIRSRSFWGATAAYSLFYVCRLTLSVVKQPLIDDGVLTAGQLGIIGSAMLLVYALGKFFNGFIADYCNIRRFMATGLLVSSAVNLILGALGLATSAASVPAFALMTIFAVLWGLNGWAQSMGAAPGVISLSRWYPLKTRGTRYSIFSATPYIGETLSFVALGFIAGRFGWEACFIAASAAGLAGAAIILIFVSDTPQSKGLPSIQKFSGEPVVKEDLEHTSVLQKAVLRHPGIWVIAISSAFIYITKYALAGWGVLFLQKARGMSLGDASGIIALSAAVGVVGTVLAGWLSDKVFKGDRAIPALLSGILGAASLAGFLLIDAGSVVAIVFVSLFSLASGVLYCIVAGLMAIDLVPRKATGAAIGIVGICCYAAAALQDSVSGWLIQRGSAAGDAYDFLPAGIFWLAAAVLSFILPVIFWKKLKSDSGR